MTANMSKGRKFLLGTVTFLLFSIILFFVAELMVRIISPRSTSYPAMKYSAEYGAVLYENETVIHKQPGHFEFHYTVNELGFRGKPTFVSNSYPYPNLVILGDSFSFGHGVNDGEEYASILFDKLKGKVNVINLGIGGWGLTQQIRKFYEFGILYDPNIVIIQFFHNDPVDNLNNQVTVIDNGRFKFQNSNSNTNWVKKYVSHSWIQKSQLYSLLRTSAIVFWKGNMDNAQKEEFTKFNNISGIPAEEKYYIELLDTFAADLKNRGIKLYFFSINDALPIFPHIERKVIDLDLKEEIKFINIDPWFKTPADMEPSPAGHYGTRWNEIVGTKLAEYVLTHQDTIKVASTY